MFATPPLLSAVFGRRLPLGCFVNARVLRDHSKREAFAAAEQTRQALRCALQCSHFRQTDRQLMEWRGRYIAQNTQLEPRQRFMATVQLAQMPANTRPMKIKNRCIMGGKGRGILRDFRISRVSLGSGGGWSGVGGGLTGG